MGKFRDTQFLISSCLLSYRFCEKKNLLTIIVQGDSQEHTPNQHPLGYNPQTPLPISSLPLFFHSLYPLPHIPSLLVNTSALTHPARLSPSPNIYTWKQVQWDKLSLELMQYVTVVLSKWSVPTHRWCHGIVVLIWPLDKIPLTLPLVVADYLYYPGMLWECVYLWKWRFPVLSRVKLSMGTAILSRCDGLKMEYFGTSLCKCTKGNGKKSKLFWC